MNSNNYKNLKEILNSLNLSIDALENGQLNVDQLATILQDARELHERIAILQYLSVAPKQAPVAEVKPEVVEPKAVSPEKKSLNFTFAFEEEVVIPTNQTNLLDAIQEEAKIVPIPVIEKLPVSEPIPDPVKQEPIAPEFVAPEPIKEEKIISEPKPETSKQPVTESINDKFSGQVEKVTLADKLSKKPINNLVEAIGLNQKFLFMNDLFEGENNLYKEAVNSLNNFSNFTEANAYIGTLFTRHKWDSSSHTVREFVELVERRFMNA